MNIYNSDTIPCTVLETPTFHAIIIVLKEAIKKTNYCAVFERSIQIRVGTIRAL